ncbi:LysR family transcriptional regulator [Shewanella sp. VB17]|uniref:LysR family transcriptional regulator n=1 Tax=Shewanella sp. VB17 TaxID=2739432 RepID=UPI0020B6C407|nr:LysR family transcriptional regulator [Shewanella sp. VB17]
MHNKLNRIDLNLLKLFSALYVHGNVSVAAESINLSQSAFSHALARLRVQLDDALFIRSNARMIPTQYAISIHVRVAEVLTTLNSCLGPQPDFTPLNSRHEFNFAVTDFTTLLMMPRLIAHLARVAPSVRINLTNHSEKLPISAFETGNIDFSLGYSHDETEHTCLINEWIWWEDSYCTLANNRLLSLDLSTFLERKHILISPWGDRKGVVDKQLNLLGHHRDIAVQLPNVMNAPFLVAESDLLITLPKFAAVALQKALPIKRFDVPFAMPKYQLKLFTYRPTQDSPENRWMLAQLKQLFKSENMPALLC